MNVWTLCRFFVGSRDAIQKVAETKSVLWLGLLFVISAGFAREYDGEDLLHEPWHLALPLVASLGTSFLLFVLVCFAGGLNRWQLGTFANEYRRFLGLYWMTAPLAWLYAFPVERWMSPASATQTNLQLLGLVALWRVVLMIRIISVVYSTRWYVAAFIVLFFSDTVMLTLLYLTPLPVFSIMGGVRLSDSERVLQDISCLARVLGTITWPFWAITALVAIAKRPLQPYVPQENLEKLATGISAWLLGVAAILVWIPILPMTQPEQQLRREVEQDLRGGRIERALTTMSEHDRVDFPPHWDPPPRIGYGETSPSIIEVLEIAIKSDVAAWVLEVFQQKFEDSMGTGYHSHYLWEQLDNEEFDRYLNLIEQLPPSPEFIKEHQEPLRWQISDDDVGRTEEQKTRLRQLLDEAAKRESLGNDVNNEEFN